MYTFEQDSALIDRIVIINAGLSKDPAIIRKAGLVDMLGGAFETIKKSVSEKVKEDGVDGTLVHYLINGALWRVNKFLMVIPIIMEAFGIDAGKIYNLIKDKLKGTDGQITDADAKRIAEEVGGGISATASLDYLHQLSKEGNLSTAMAENELTKEAGLFGPLASIFTRVGRGKRGKSLIGGIIKWAVYALLSGFAITEASSLAKSTVVDDEEETSSGAGQGAVGAGQGAVAPRQQAKVNIPISKTNLKSSGQGESYFLNTPQNQWWINAPDIKGTLLYWAKKVYPELVGHDNEIRMSKSFDNIAYILSSGRHPTSSNYLKVPPSNLHTWKDIVDVFAGEAEARVMQKKQQLAKQQPTQKPQQQGA